VDFRDQKGTRMREIVERVQLHRSGVRSRKHSPRRATATHIINGLLIKT